MNFKGVRIYLSVYLIVYFFSINAQIQSSDKSIGNQQDNQEYLYVFGEATKLFLLGSYPQAVNLYKECLKINPLSSASHFQLAKMFLQAGEVAMATEHAKKACDFEPENVWYQQELAQIYQIKEKFDSALMIYEGIIRKNPENSDISFIMAALYERTARYKEALSCLERIERRNGISKETAVTRSRIYESMGKFDAAHNQLQVALQLSENEYSVIGLMAEFYRKNGRSDSARFYYLKIYPKYQNDAVVVFSYAEFLMEQKQYEDAQRVMLAAMKNDSLNHSAKAGYLYKIIQDEKLYKLNKEILDTVASCYYNMYLYDNRARAIFADIELRLGNYRKSSEALKKIIYYDKGNYPAYEQLLFCENSLGNVDTVSFYAEEAIKNFPGMPIPYLFNGSAGYQKKEYDNAISILEKGLSLNKNEKLEVEFYTLLAECYARIKNFDKSEIYYKKALDIDKNNNSVANNFAYNLALRKKDLEYARTISKVTIKNEPKNSTFLDTYGWILFNMNKIINAKKYIKMAIEYGGDKNSEILYHYGEIMIRLKRYKESQIILRKALLFADNEEKERINELLKKAEIGIKQR